MKIGAFQEGYVPKSRLSVPVIKQRYEEKISTLNEKISGLKAELDYQSAVRKEYRAFLEAETKRSDERSEREKIAFEARLAVERKIARDLQARIDELEEESESEGLSGKRD